MERILRFLRSPVGRKVIMALTGLSLVGFLVPHLLGNFLALKSAEEFNMYSHALTSSWLIYFAEGGLLLVFLFHTVNGIDLVMRNRAARGARDYERKEWAGHSSRKSFASATMIFTGAAILLFVIFHVASMKYGFELSTLSFPSEFPTATHHGTEMRDLHSEVLHKFSMPGLAFFYVVMMGLVGLHLWHGIGSAFESLGARHRRGLRVATQLVAASLALAFASIPLILFAQHG